MSPFTHPGMTTDGAIYDLHAVCSHYGRMNFGHYIAYCKPYSEEELDTLSLRSTDGKLDERDVTLPSGNLLATMHNQLSVSGNGAFCRRPDIFIFLATLVTIKISKTS